MIGKHLVALDTHFLDLTAHVILIREPHGLILSFDKALGNVSVEDTCLPDQVPNPNPNPDTGTGTDSVLLTGFDLRGARRSRPRPDCGSVRGSTFRKISLPPPASPAPTILTPDLSEGSIGKSRRDSQSTVSQARPGV